MSRYSGPRLRIFKRLGPLPGFGKNIHEKYQKQNSQELKKTKKQKNKAYSLRLIEKQKLRYNYGLTEKNLAKYVRNAQKQKKSTGEILLKNLEMRLDNIVFRCGFTSTLPAARQLITHGHVFLNGKKRTRPSIPCKPQDSITLNKKIQTYYGQAPKSSFLSLDAKNNRGKVHQTIKRKDVHLNIKELLVIEYYSRRNG
uniref:Small ribosomal subunit protein uS4c n=1 Tax=Johnson-sea-linkia profunda TaxID=575876 RepID=A0A386AXN5_9CHLO|nr:ribosomal protein S4 [Johnson-sea-linkia profunda]